MNGEHFELLVNIDKKVDEQGESIATIKNEVKNINGYIAEDKKEKKSATIKHNSRFEGMEKDLKSVNEKFWIIAGGLSVAIGFGLWLLGKAL